jgi:hypothetical protein
VFVQQDGGHFVATELARGPWDPNAQHGGAPAGLLAHAFDALATADGLALARLTYEFVRPVPLGELAVHAEIVRPGRRVQLLDGTIATVDGVELVRARALRVERAVNVPLHALSVGDVPPGPEHGSASDWPARDVKVFAADAMEIRFVAGGFMDPGPASAWFRLRVPMIDGTDPTPLQRLAAAADFGNGISSVLPWDGYVFINPDLTVYVEREPVGEWICLESSTRIAGGGVGFSESVLYDEQGRVGRAAQALLVAPR